MQFLPFLPSEGAAAIGRPQLQDSRRPPRKSGGTGCYLRISRITHQRESLGFVSLLFYLVLRKACQFAVRGSRFAVRSSQYLHVEC